MYADNGSMHEVEKLEKSSDKPDSSSHRSSIDFAVSGKIQEFELKIIEKDKHIEALNKRIEQLTEQLSKEVKGKPVSKKVEIIQPNLPSESGIPTGQEMVLRRIPSRIPDLSIGDSRTEAPWQNQGY